MSALSFALPFSGFLYMLSKSTVLVSFLPISSPRWDYSRDETAIVPRTCRMSARR